MEKEEVKTQIKNFYDKHREAVLVGAGSAVLIIIQAIAAEKRVVGKEVVELKEQIHKESGIHRMNVEKKDGTSQFFYKKTKPKA